MIADMDIGGVLVPGLLALACLALLATVIVLQLLSITGLSRRLALPALTEIALFLLLFGLLVRVLPMTGNLL